MKTYLFCCVILTNFLVAKVLAKIPQLDGRIIGGTDANITDFPYQVSLRRYSGHVCGASIFHPSYVLTAAHCVSNGLARSYSIRTGSNYLSSGGTITQVCGIHVHQNYSSETMVNDIAILALCNPLSFSNLVLPITLAGSLEKVQIGNSGIVTGWGFTEEEGSVSSTLKKVEVPIITTSRCQVLYPDEELTDGMICAGYVGSGNKDACQGDSGGPLRVNGKLCGVVSWGYGCARPWFPGVYTNVAKYRSWIKYITKY